MKLQVLSISFLVVFSAVTHADGHDTHASKGGMTAKEAEAGGVTVYGAFRRFMHMADFSSKVMLRDLPQSDKLIGLGAVAGLEGEITVLDGQRVVSLGSAPQARLDAKAASTIGAALLVTAQVPAWTAVQVTRRVDSSAVAQYVLEQARQAGLPDASSFAFLVKGRMASYKAHVLHGANAGFKGHGSGVPMARMVDESGALADGTIVGFLASESDVGIITHPGERVHAHFVAADGSRTTHVDAFSIEAGSTLLLPQR